MASWLVSRRKRAFLLSAGCFKDTAGSRGAAQFSSFLAYASGHTYTGLFFCFCSLGWHPSSGEIASQSDTDCWTVAACCSCYAEFTGNGFPVGAFTLVIYGGRGERSGLPESPVSPREQACLALAPGLSLPIWTVPALDTPQPQSHPDAHDEVNDVLTLARFLSVPFQVSIAFNVFQTSYSDELNVDLYCCNYLDNLPF